VVDAMCEGNANLASSHAGTSGGIGGGGMGKCA
jgi:hypothetical protein